MSLRFGALFTSREMVLLGGMMPGMPATMASINGVTVVI
jgi:hypothetical protein